MIAPCFPPLSPLTQRLALIVGHLCAAVAARGGRDRSLTELVRLTWTRLSRTVMRFERLVLRIAAGRPAIVRQAGLKRASVARDPAAFRLPRGFLWLVVRMPETSAFGSQLRHLLDAPEMAALLASDPRAARILRPMCRMLGVAHPAVGIREPASAGPAKRPKMSAVSVPSVWAKIAGPAPEAPQPPARWVVFRRSD